MLFRVLGEVDVERDGDTVQLGGPQQRRLLALLLSERGRVVSTDRLVDALWSDGEPPDGASRSVMKYVSRLRAALGETVIVTVGAGYRLELNGHGCDADDLRRARRHCAPRAAGRRGRELRRRAWAVGRPHRIARPLSPDLPGPSRE